MAYLTDTVATIKTDKFDDSLHYSSSLRPRPHVHGKDRYGRSPAYHVIVGTMATLAEEVIGRIRPADVKHTRSPKSKSTSLKHKTRTPTDVFKQSEQSLRELLEDFESGRLDAFGELICTYR